jgi:hypothetical protein
MLGIRRRGGAPGDHADHDDGRAHRGRDSVDADAQDDSDADIHAVAESGPHAARGPDGSHER